MATIDETKFNSGIETETKKQEESTEKKTSWKEITLGGATGIVLGVATTAGIEAFAKEPVIEENVDEPEILEIGENVKVAESVKDEMSFSEAFAQARHEVGAGGAFVWRDQVYSTYNKEEWDGMTDDQKSEYWDAVRGTDVIGEPETDGSETDEPQLVETGEIADGSYEVYDTTGNGQGDYALVDVDGDGTADVEVVDVDDDGVADIMAADINGDGIVDESEVFQITDEGVVSMEEVSGSAGEDYSEPTSII